jgi:hypothetical protein
MGGVMATASVPSGKAKAEATPEVAADDMVAVLDTPARACAMQSIELNMPIACGNCGNWFPQVRLLRLPKAMGLPLLPATGATPRVAPGIQEGT